MVPYLSCFLITGVFAQINDYSLKKKYKIFTVLTALLVILLPALLAGFRSYEVGTDVNFYVKRGFDLALNFGSVSDWLNLSDIPGYIVTSQEKGYLLLMYIVSRFSTIAHVFLFVVSAIENVMVYLALYKLKSRCSIFMGEIIFLFTQYNSFYNMVRQGIAMSICLFAVAILLSNEKQKYIKFVLWILVAFEFHKTAIIALVFLGIYMLLKNTNNNILRQAVWMIMLMGIVVCIFPLMNHMIDIGMLPARYLEYFRGGTTYDASQKMPILGLLIYVSGCLVLFQGFKYLGKDRKFFISIAILDILLINLTNVSFYLYRVASYFLIIRVLSMSQRSLYNLDLTVGRSDYDNPVLLWIESVGSVVIYFMYFIVNLNWHQTIPYMFTNH